MDSTEVVSKILAWVEEKEYVSEGCYVVNSNDITDFINELKRPPKKLQWHYRTRDNNDWKPATDEEYEAGCELARFEWKQFEV